MLIVVVAQNIFLEFFVFASRKFTKAGSEVQRKLTYDWQVVD